MGNGTDYTVYRMNKRERTLYFLIGAAVGGLIGYLFYESLILSVIAAAVCGTIFVPVRRKQIMGKRSNKLLLQFKDMLESLSTSIGAGSNVQDSFMAAQKDMTNQFTEDSDIVKELKIVNSGIQNGIGIEKLLLDIGDRSGLADIVSFANVFDTCYRKGGNIKDVIKNTHQIISDKIDITLEIQTVVSSKTSEQNAMLIMPVIFVVLLRSMGTEVVNLSSATGRMSTTLAVFCFAGAYLISKKILNIRL